MSCYHPLKGFPIGVTAKGNTKYKISPYSTEFVFKYQNKWLNHKQDDPFFMEGLEQQHEFIEIPCGRCTGCRLQYSRDWANRCMLELKEHKSSYFVTLTYDDEHLPTVEHIDDETGLITNLATLRKKDLSNFMKMLRQKLEAEGKPQIRFFGCGEYGEHTARCHFHVIIFGLELDDLILYKRSELGDNLYNSPLLSSVWKKGHVVVGDVTWESCAYVARYVTKKKYGKEAEFYEKYGIAPEFTLMSRRPGIARDYFEKNKDTLFMSDFIDIATEKGGRRMTPGIKYFKNLNMEYDPEGEKSRRELNKQFAVDFNEFKMESTSKSYLDMLQTEENILESKVKSLIREL